jgi:hypothetical protein
MHAVVVQVTVNDPENAQERLQSEVVPRVSSSPGFQAGYWTRMANKGLSMVIFDSEENARTAAERIPEGMPEGVTLENIDVREVVASA